MNIWFGAWEGWGIWQWLWLTIATRWLRGVTGRHGRLAKGSSRAFLKRLRQFIDSRGKLNHESYFSSNSDLMGSYFKTRLTVLPALDLSQKDSWLPQQLLFWPHYFSAHCTNRLALKWRAEFLTNFESPNCPNNESNREEISILPIFVQPNR